MGRATIPGWLAAAAIVVAAQCPSALRADEIRIRRTPEFVERVDSAIDRGVRWLRGAQRAGGGYEDHGPYPGAMTALAYMTMRACGVPRDDPDALKAFESMRTAYLETKRGAERRELRTYAVALFCMALAEHGDPGAPSDRSSQRPMKLSGEDSAWMKEMVKLLEQWQDDAGRWSYPIDARGGRQPYDHSNTQYALLGLEAASRAGVSAHAGTWRKSLRHLLDAQDDDGAVVPRFEPGEKGRTSANATDRARGWSYTARGAPYGSMTAGGVGSVVICRSQLLGTRDYPPPLDEKAEQSARDGIAWLGVNFSVATNPAARASKAAATMAGPMWHHYYLYALERAGVLARVEWMGEHDWYGEGAEHLLGEQLASGAWRQKDGAFGGVPMRRAGAGESSQVTLATCFALLFLKRGTVPVARGALTQAPDETEINFAAAASLSDADFDDFLDLVLSRWRRAAASDGKERLLARATAVGSRIVLPLIERLAATKDAEREAAFALLRRATGIDHGYDPAAPPGVRENAVARWEAWWLANETTLHYDAAEGRIVGK